MSKRSKLCALLLLATLSFVILAAQPHTTKPRITSSSLLSPKGKTLIGRTITLYYQPVQLKTGDQAFWVGRNEDEMVLVAMPATIHPFDTDGEPVKLEEGDIVEIEGIVTRAPSDYELKKGWGVNNDDLFLIDKAGVIIIAQNVKLVRSYAD